MRVFISWSGNRSKSVAQLLRDWLPAVIQAARPYFSPNDIAKGARWSSEVALELQESKIGILCVTSENLLAPWLMFEAGALAKSLDQSRVIPLLFDLEPSALTGPLAQFQAVKFEEQEVRKLVAAVNEQLGPAALAESVLDSVFDKWWPELEAGVSRLREAAPSKNTGPQRSDRELIEEVLGIVRDLRFRRSSGRTISIDVDQLLHQPIESLNLTDLALQALRAAEIDTVKDLLAFTEVALLKTPKVGRRSLNEVKEVLASYGLSLAPQSFGGRER